MIDVYRQHANVSSCSVERFIEGSIIVDYVLGFAPSDNTPNATALDQALREYTSNCNQSCFGTNSSASFTGYEGMTQFKTQFLMTKSTMYGQLLDMIKIDSVLKRFSMYIHKCRNQKSLYNLI